MTPNSNCSSFYWQLVVLVFIAVLTVGVGRMALAKPDKYAVKVPGGLALSEIMGYEDWPTLSASLTDNAFALILANPVMIEAYRSGSPGNGKPFPDGSKMVKVHYKPGKMAEAPDPSTKCRERYWTSTSWCGTARGSPIAATGATPRSNTTRRQTP